MRVAYNSATKQIELHIVDGSVSMTEAFDLTDANQLAEIILATVGAAEENHSSEE